VKVHEITAALRSIGSDILEMGDGDFVSEDAEQRLPLRTIKQMAKELGGTYGGVVGEDSAHQFSFIENMEKDAVKFVQRLESSGIRTASFELVEGKDRKGWMVEVPVEEVGD
jgi:hypothetical protein